MATSVVPAVMAQLKTSLAARPGLAGVQISDGFPWQPDTEYIAILGADPHQQSSTGMMTGASAIREEEFELLLSVSTIRTGDDDHALVVARAYQLVAEIETQLRADITIGGTLGTNGWSAITGLPIHKNGPDNDSRREAAIEVHITCRAWI